MFLNYISSKSNGGFRIGRSSNSIFRRISQIFVPEFDVKVSITDEDIQELQERNSLRIAAAKQQLGNKWLLHPENKVKRR